MLFLWSFFVLINLHSIFGLRTKCNCKGYHKISLVPLFSHLLTGSGNPLENKSSMRNKESDKELPDDVLGRPADPMPSVSSKINYGDEAPKNVRYDLWVVGAGTLGEIVCRNYKEKHPDAIILGETATTTRHDRLSSYGAIPRLSTHRQEDEACSAKNMVIALTPSSCPDYVGAINDAIRYWAGPLGGGSLIFTSSLAVYGESDGQVVNETYRLDTRSQRSTNLIAAEEAVLARDGVAIRFAGLYNDMRGPHSYWLRLAREGKQIETNADGMVNMIHYEDAASLIVAAIDAKLRSTALIGVDDEPITKREICMSALASKLYPDNPIPQFQTENGMLGKRCDGSYTKALLHWRPKYPSFRRYMRALGGETEASAGSETAAPKSALWLPGDDDKLL